MKVITPRAGLDTCDQVINSLSEKTDATQIPVVFSVKLHSRFRGMISAEGREVIFEGGVNAR